MLSFPAEGTQLRHRGMRPPCICQVILRTFHNIEIVNACAICVNNEELRVMNADSDRIICCLACMAAGVLNSLNIGKNPRVRAD